MRGDIDMNYFEQRLRDRLEEITAGLEAGKKGVAPVELDQSRIGRVSRMDAMQQQALAQAAARLAGAEKARIQKALDRMKSGDFGYCVNCEEDIPEKRLHFDPSVLFCVACARAAESS